MAGRLVLVATPIGNLGDFSERAKTALSEADLWLVEDTRVSGKLQGALGVKKPMKVLNDHTGDFKLNEYADAIAQGSIVAVVSDAGTPVVSDPGAELVALCRQRQLPVDSIPGPSAVSVALTLSGFYAQRYAFLGFLSRKSSQAVETLQPFQESALTIVLFESQFRIEATLEACHQALGSRNYVICRELTKMHQQVWSGTLPAVPGVSEVPRKGEFTIVVEGHRRNREA